MKGILALGLLTQLATTVMNARAQTVVEYVHTDALGSVVAITDANQSVIETNDYEPYGRLTNRSAVDGPQYTGHVADSATDLLHMQQRYYDPALGRFLSVDPVTAYSGNKAGFNRYWYASGNPYRFTDPDGRWFCEGSRARCAVAQAAARRIDTALKNNNLSPQERTQLNGARNYIGDYNAPDNKVVIKFGPAPAGASGYVDVRGDLVLDENKAKREAWQGNGASGQENTENALARNITHEADHALRFANKESITRMNREVEGYRAAAIYQKASGWLDQSNNAWDPRNGGIDENVLKAQARFSVGTSCAAGGCESP
ncbi:RHS repeat-associated core domain-containing protein [Lysobacter sp. CA199]|uniref:RHS repeat-associated core domain-containing protein n=1 Tax=Lysobacter sp. CA199 TaxID=3455608 RepID=UPI003F8D7C1B